MGKISALPSLLDGARRSVLVVDDSHECSLPMAQAFSRLGIQVWSADSFKEACVVLETANPGCIVCELRIGDEFAFEFIEEMSARCPRPRIVVATYYPTIETTIRATRLGADAYLAKPVTASLILRSASLAARSQDQCAEWKDEATSLDQTIWRYLNDVYSAAGSMSEAARRLGLDRRSLRRMLNRPPA